MADALYGYVGTLLKINLTDATVEKIPTTTYDVDKWIGGRGLGSIIQWTECSPEVGAFDPENIITFLTGPVTGTVCDGGRTIVQAVSPIGYPDTGSFCRSTFGGGFGAELKFAGYDGIIITGQSEKPVYLYINDDTVEIRDAADLWGLDNFATQNELWKRSDNKACVASIGPAGEHQCLMSTILCNESSVTGLGSYGAVMGNKKLKAISVQGTGGVPIADPEGLLEFVTHFQSLACRKLYETDDEHNFPNSFLGSWLACLALKDSDLYKEVRNPNGKLDLGYSGCYGCTFGGCGYTVRYKDGSNISIGQFRCTEAIPTNGEMTQTGEFVGRTHIKRLTLNERLGFSDCTLWFQGLDPMVDAGILNEETTGMDWSEFGSAEFTEKLMYDIAYRRTEVGDALANGYRYFLENFVGTPEAIRYYRAIRGVRNSPKHNGGGCGNWYLPGAYLAHGLLRFATSNLCAVDIRCTGSETHLNFAVNPKLGSLGDEKLQAWTDANSMKRFGNVETQRDVQNWNWESPYAGTYIKWSHSFKAFLDSALFCFMQEGSGIGTSNYTDDLTGDDHIAAELYTCVTGKEFTPEDEDNFGWRIYLLERSILMRQGLTRADDELFDEVYEEYATENVDKSIYQMDTGLTRERFDGMLERFYDAMGMDCETGYPCRSTYEQLNIPEIADRLEEEYGLVLPA